MPTLKALIRTHNVRADVTYGADYNEDFPQSNPWTVTLKMARRQMIVPFYTGPAIEGEPTAEDVLDCLLSDAAGYDNAPSFEDWAAEYGYDPDSRKAEKTYRAVERQTNKLRRFLGDDYEAFLYAER